MERYRFTRDYGSSLGQYTKGDEVEFDADTAAWLERDAPGAIEPVKASADTRAVDEPPQDRQVKRAPRKRGA